MNERIKVSADRLNEMTAEAHRLIAFEKSARGILLDLQRVLSSRAITAHEAETLRTRALHLVGPPEIVMGEDQS